MSDTDDAVKVRRTDASLDIRHHKVVIGRQFIDCMMDDVTSETESAVA